MADVKLVGVGKSFGDARILDKVDLDIRDGEFIVSVGPSGCGKSTLLRLIAGLEDITDGELRIGARLSPLFPADALSIIVNAKGNAAVPLKRRTVSVYSLTRD